MLRHIVPVLRNGCSTSVPFATRAIAFTYARTSCITVDISTRYNLHVTALCNIGIKGPDDISEPIEFFDEGLGEASTGDVDATTLEDVAALQSVESPKPQSKKKKKAKKENVPKSTEAEGTLKLTRAQRRMLLREKKGDTKAKQSAAGGKAQQSIAEAVAVGNKEEAPVKDSAIVGETQEIDPLKEGAAEVVKTVLKGQNISAESLKKNKKKKKEKAKSKKPAKIDASKAPKQPQFTNYEAQPAKGEATEVDVNVDINTIKASDIQFEQVEQGEEVAKLHHGLERVLFNPGVYFLQDPRSGVYNFDPFLAKIMPVDEFDFRALKEYITSSKDTNLAAKARQYFKKFSGSTSSMTATLSQFHFLISNWRPINVSSLSRDIKTESLNYTRITRAPSAAFLHYDNGAYAMDADKEFDTPNILSMLGKSMEKLLTMKPENFNRYHRSRSAEISQEERDAEEAYSFSTLSDWMVRSQLDANDARLPGVGNFDLKTRAVVSIRMDTEQFKEMNGYEIVDRTGNFESYEREYYDMIRSAFLKYSLQVRMGNMDGIFVAYHNTNRIFGFQYISLNEMDLAIHGTKNTEIGDAEFRLSLQMLNDILKRVTEKYPEQSLRITVETRPTTPPLMYFFAEPMTKPEIEAIQFKNKAEIQRFENEMMAYKDEPEATTEEEAPAEEEIEEETAAEETEEQFGEDGPWSSEAVWEELTSKAEDAVESDELGLPYVRRAIQVALRQSGLLKHDTTGEQGRAYVNDLLETLTGTQAEAEEAEAGETSEDGPREHIVTEDAILEVSGTQNEPVKGKEESARLEKVKDIEEEESGELARPETPGQSSLKDLIRHMASQVDDYKQSINPEEPADESDNKLHNFARILSELVTKNKTVEAPAATEAPETKRGPLTGYIITMKNKVGKTYTTRVNTPEAAEKWTIEYKAQEMVPDRAWRIYQQVKERRCKTMARPDDTDAEKISKFSEAYTEQLRKLSHKGRLYRALKDREEMKKPVRLLEASNKHIEFNWKDIFNKPAPFPPKLKKSEEPELVRIDDSLKDMSELIIEVEDEDFGVSNEEAQVEAAKKEENA